MTQKKSENIPTVDEISTPQHLYYALQKHAKTLIENLELLNIQDQENGVSLSERLENLTDDKRSFFISSSLYNNFKRQGLLKKLDTYLIPYGMKIRLDFYVTDSYSRLEISRAMGRKNKLVLHDPLLCIEVSVYRDPEQHLIKEPLDVSQFSRDIQYFMH